MIFVNYRTKVNKNTPPPNIYTVLTHFNQVLAIIFDDENKNQCNSSMVIKFSL